MLSEEMKINFIEKIKAFNNETKNYKIRKVKTQKVRFNKKDRKIGIKSQKLK